MMMKREEIQNYTPRDKGETKLPKKRDLFPLTFKTGIKYYFTVELE